MFESCKIIYCMSTFICGGAVKPNLNDLRSFFCLSAKGRKSAPKLEVGMSIHISAAVSSPSRPPPAPPPAAAHRRGVEAARGAAGRPSLAPSGPLPPGGAPVGGGRTSGHARQRPPSDELSVASNPSENAIPPLRTTNRAYGAVVLAAAPLSLLSAAVAPSHVPVSPGIPPHMYERARRPSLKPCTAS